MTARFRVIESDAPKPPEPDGPRLSPEQEANQKISELLKAAAEALGEAEKIANNHSISFNFSPGGYGEGHNFQGASTGGYWSSNEDNHWNSSSVGC